MSSEEIGMKREKPDFKAIANELFDTLVRVNDMYLNRHEISRREAELEQDHVAQLLERVECDVKDK